MPLFAGAMPVPDSSVIRLQEGERFLTMGRPSVLRVLSFYFRQKTFRGGGGGGVKVANKNCCAASLISFLG